MMSTIVLLHETPAIQLADTTATLRLKDRAFGALSSYCDLTGVQCKQASRSAVKHCGLETLVRSLLSRERAGQGSKPCDQYPAIVQEGSCRQRTGSVPEGGP